ncbi:hypothetical protein KUCAC02_002417, partial [Chaenocephalus aceratus]
YSYSMKHSPCAPHLFLPLDGTDPRTHLDKQSFRLALTLVQKRLLPPVTGCWMLAGWGDKQGYCSQAPWGEILAAPGERQMVQGRMGLPGLTVFDLR